MSDHYTDALSTGPASRSGRLDQVLATLLRQAPDVQAAAVVSFDGLPMAAMLPPGMDEDRVAAMSAALLSLGERAAEGLGRGALSQVYVEGEHGTVFLVSADDEAVLVAVGAQGAKVGMLLFEVRRAAQAVADTLRPLADEPAPFEPAPFEPVAVAPAPVEPEPAPVVVDQVVAPVAAPVPAPVPAEPTTLPQPPQHRAEPPVTVVAASEPQEPVQEQVPQPVEQVAQLEPPQDVQQVEQVQPVAPEPVVEAVATPVPQLAPPPRVEERRDWNGHGPDQTRRPSATW